MRLSNSKANTWRRCPKKYHYKYGLGLRSKTRELPLERGSWLHEMLEAYYVTGDWRPKWKELKKAFYTLFEEEREDLGDLPEETKRIMLSYERKWKKEDRRYRVVDSELDEILTMSNGLEFNFIIDLVVEDLEVGGLWLWDHKTVKSFMDEDYMLLDAQLARYFWAAEKMGYTPLKGVVFNEIRTKPPAIPELLKSGALSQRANIDTDYFTYAREIKRHGLSTEPYEELLGRLRQNSGRFFRRTVMPKDTALTKRTMQDLLDTAEEIEAAGHKGRYPRSVSKNCTWDCEFKDVCITEYFGGDATSLMSANFETREEQKKKRAAKVKKERKMQHV